MRMNNRITLSLAAVATLFVVGCTTEVGPNGQSRSVMTPLGAAALQSLAAAGIGAGTGALMPHMNSVAAGAISAGAGSVGSQAIGALIPKAGSSQPVAQQQVGPYLYTRTEDGSFAPVKLRYIQQPDGSYVPSYPPGRPLYRLLSNGAFAPAN